MNYTEQEYKLAYKKWVETPYLEEEERLNNFYIYCDHRDGLPLGTSKKKALEGRSHLTLVKGQKNAVA